MTFLYNLFVLFHLLGMAALVGGYVVTLPDVRVNDWMLWGARIQLISGLIIVGLGEGPLDKEYSYAKIATKLIISVIVVALVEIARARESRGEPNPNLINVAGVLAIINVIIAVLWTYTPAAVEEVVVESMALLR